MNKKYLAYGFFALFGIMLVGASVLIYLSYNHNFTKTINVFKDGGSSQYVSVSGSGDIVSTVINCDATTTECTVHSGTITLSNSDTIAHDCTVTTTGSSNVVVSYDKPVAPITVPASGSINFQIGYTSNTAGAYPMVTTINCP